MSPSDRGHWWTIPTALAALAAGAWLRSPQFIWVAAAAAASLGAVWLLLPGGQRRRRVLAFVLLALPVVMVIVQWRVWRIAAHWPDEREARIERASARLQRDLTFGVTADERIATRATADCALGRTDAFQRLADLTPGSEAELSVAILDADGTPWAWAGRHRLLPDAAGDSLTVRASKYYLLLESRHPCAAHRTVVASLLIWADPVDPDRGASLVERFRAATGVSLQVYPAGTAPNDADVFDYQVDAPAGPRTLFSVRPQPPGQADARAATLEVGAGMAGWLLVLLLLVSISVSTLVRQRLAFSVIGLGLLAFVPLGSALGAATLFSSATFFRSLLGPFSASAGILGATGVTVFVAGVALWRHRLRRTWPGSAVGIVLLIGAPFLVSDLARGITPPVDGVPLSLWLTWQCALMTAAAALVMIAAALLRGREDAGKMPRTHWVAIAVALIATAVGLIVWNPHYGWPDWYTFLWAPALVLLMRPAPKWAVVLGVGLVAGSAAGLVTWGAELEGRLLVAGRDIGRLGDEPDPFAVPQLEKFAQQVSTAPVPSSAAELYALWHASAIAQQDYPAVLTLWSPDGTPQVELPLDSLDLPERLVAAFVRNMDTTVSTEVASLARVPGIHYLLLVRLSDHQVLSAAVGPRTALIQPDRLSRLLDQPARGAPLYDLLLSYPGPEPVADSARLVWVRQGWEVRGERLIALPGGIRHVHARVDLRGPAPLLVRGVLVLLLDVAALALLWLLGELLVGWPLGQLPIRRWTHSFRLRLGLTLAVFFVVPAAGFAVWSVVRVGRDGEREQDLLLTQALRAAQPLAAAVLQGPPEQTADGLRDLSRRANLDVGLYQGGELIGVSAPVLADLGVLPPLLTPDAYTDLALSDALERVESVPGAGHTLRMGYRVVRPGTAAGVGIIAAPRLGDDPSLGQEQLDLVYVLLLATLLGTAAAVLAAGVVARALSRPVSDLRRAAVALGQGLPAPSGAATPPVEFEPVFGAFSRMAADVRASQAALDDARRRTATVLRTVATGVIAVDSNGAVLLANPRARELLEAPLLEGAPFESGLPSALGALVRSVRRAVASGRSPHGPIEVSLGGRRLGCEFAELGADLRGVVVAVTDLTDASQAARVLAWGEMARQVAHEIKNPLTPLRLGVQHLRRVRQERPAEFEGTFDATAERILAEIDRLDTIARAFSRFAAPAEAAPPLAPVDLQAVASEVLHLYRLGGDVAVELVSVSEVSVRARRDEVKEVLVNLVENARNANARRIVVRCDAQRLAVEDDGEGIPDDLLPRIFEPRFSTTTSGSGLGLSIVKRLVEGWGATVSVSSRPQAGTVVSIAFPLA
ncbi:MAG TPA: ATP-binding protein [Gemmatimonadales bacterium]|nr:ATP-binding protein [Gemmatimonadales bacterium]